MICFICSTASQMNLLTCLYSSCEITSKFPSFFLSCACSYRLKIVSKFSLRLEFTMAPSLFYRVGLREAEGCVSS